MPKTIAKKVKPTPDKEIKKTPPRKVPAPKAPSQRADPKKAPQKKVPLKKAAPAKLKEEEGKKPSIRAIYANSKNTLMPLGFGTDFKTKKMVVIFSDLQTAKVHTITLAMWNRMKLKEVKGINPEI